MHGTTESSGLLHHEPTNAPRAQPGRSVRDPSTLVWILLAIVIIQTCGDQLMENPQTRIFESIICYRYYELVDPSKIQIGRDHIGPGAIGGVAEMACKTDQVQSELAELHAYQQFLDGFPTLMLAVPFGWAADKYGRKPLMVLGLSSIILRSFWILFVSWFWQSFDIRITWLSTLYALLSGGWPVYSSLFYVTLSDLITPLRRGNVFLRFNAANSISILLMNPVAALLMEYNPWIPILIGMGLLLLTLSLYTFMPETMNYRYPSLAIQVEAPTEHPTEIEPSHLEPTTDYAPLRTGHARKLMTALQESTTFAVKYWRIIVLVLQFSSQKLIERAPQLLLQYSSTRYMLTLSRATLLLTIFTSVKVLLLIVILPAVSSAVLQYLHLSDQRKDLYLARVSQGFFFIGWICIGLAPGVPMVAIAMIITALGHGAPILIRSLLTSLVSAPYIARLYAIITVVDTVGAMSGATLLAELYRRGLALGGVWSGLPFIALGLISLVFLVLILVVQLQQDEAKAIDAQDEEYNE